MNSKLYKQRILPYQRLAQLADREVITLSEKEIGQIQPASIDLRLGDVAWRLGSSFLPGLHKSVEECIEKVALYQLDLSAKDGIVLEPNAIYLIPMIEQVSLSDNLSIRGNTKSSAGRLDLLTRMMTDYGNLFDQTRSGYKGKLYLEITSSSFYIRVRKGSSLYQIRILEDDGQEDASQLPNPELEYYPNLRHELLSLDLIQGNSGTEKFPIAFKGKKSFTSSFSEGKWTPKVLDFDKENFYKTEDFWEPIYPCGNGQIVLEPNSFYIMSSIEKISMPNNFAGEMHAYQVQAGEFRAHYAGFFDPGFKDSPVVLEVRSHGVPCLLQHGSIMGEFFYIPLSEETKMPYGTSHSLAESNIAEGKNPEANKSNYLGQKLKLSKQFIH